MEYLIEIEDPKTHIVKVTLEVENPEEEIFLFMPSWSPGSYLMREYARNLRKLKITNEKGLDVFHEKTDKGCWKVSLKKFKETSLSKSLTVFYEVYCHELTVRTSHIDESHAFLHGPSYLMGVEGRKREEVQVELKFPALWSKVATGLDDISKKREIFLYKASSYDEFIDCPIEIGCHESDGFMVNGKEHHLAFYGVQWPHKNNLKEDINKIVQFIADYMGEIPYEHYHFITHFAPDHYGGLEHLNSTALIFDGRKLNSRKDYVNWLTLVAHEYFHTWNVKRIRPVELGPFEYTKENYTSMLWLAEGLTSFMDNYFVYKMNLCSEKEYWELVKNDFNRYLQTPGRRFDSLEASSFDAWIKLYRPDENSQNSTISYYLKGGLVFLCLHALFKKEGKDTKELIHELWSDYKRRPEKGVNKKEFLSLLKKISSEKIAQWFEIAISTTEEIDFESVLKSAGISIDWEEAKGSLGINLDFKGDRVFVKSVRIDSVAYKAGLNAGDEIISLDEQRVLKDDFSTIIDLLDEGVTHRFTLCRLGRLIEKDFRLSQGERLIKEITVDQSLEW